MTATIETPSPAPEPVVTPAQARTWQIDIPGVSPADLSPLKWQFYLALLAFGIGALMGLLQALERANINLYDEFRLQSYYQGLTLHGVAMVLVFTFCFANSFLSLMTMKAYGRPLKSRLLSQASTWSAAIGVALALWAILANKATVLFTFYAPLEATPAFYVGAVLLVISTWLVLANMIWTLADWRKDHPKERVPLLAYASLISYIMWFLASLGIAVEVLFYILPWSLGWRDQVDPQFTRVLFWFTGHPIVYFWLMPIYVSWYMLLPGQVGGKIFSDGLTRIVFVAFMLLVPVGAHHQFTDPGIPFSSKTLQWLLTFAIFYPSVVTLFSVVASLESGARARGGKGLIAWIGKLPWGDPAVAGQLLAGIIFMGGGASGLVNASLTANLVVHNTAFIPGHFHLTVGTAVALSIMAISYWLIPYFTGKQLYSRPLAVVQVWTWAIGVSIFSRGQMAGGIEGVPRRTLIQEATYKDNFNWALSHALTAIGGTIMFVAAVMFFVVVFGTVFGNRAVTTVQRVPLAPIINGPRDTWAIMDRIGMWTLIAVIGIIIVLGELIFHYWPLWPVSPGIQLW